MKKQVSPAQTAVIVVVVLAVVAGLGWFIMDGSQKQYTSMPAANSRADMLHNIHSAGPSGGASDSSGASGTTRPASGPPSGLQKTD